MKFSASSSSGNVRFYPAFVPGRAGDDSAGPARARFDVALHDVVLRQPTLQDAQVRLGVGGRHGRGQESHACMLLQLVLLITVIIGYCDNLILWQIAYCDSFTI